MPLPQRRRVSVHPTEVLCVVVALVYAVRSAWPNLLAVATVQAWATVFAAVFIQAAPYVVIGVVLAVLLAVVPGAWLGRALPRRIALAVPVAALAGATLPGCECGTVPVAASMMNRGVGPGPAVSFMLSAPATNPIVLAATAAAFPGQHRVVAARFVASLLTAFAVGWCQPRASPSRRSQHDHGDERHRGPSASAARDLGRSLGLLTIGAASAATLTVLVPQAALDRLAAHDVIGIATLAGLAVVLAVCSEADAFIASSLTQFSRTAQLVFMVVGPVVDVKLVAMQLGTFGARFATRLSVLSFAVAVTAAVAIGAVLT